MRTTLISYIYAFLICVTISAGAILEVPVKASDFSFADSRHLNRLLTPNGDGKNDVFVFRCYNPKDWAVTGKIFSIAGRNVAKMTIVTNTLTPNHYEDIKWDPNSEGNKVPGGIYIYQVRVGDYAYAGTVVVIR